MSTATPQDQAFVDLSAREYSALHDQIQLKMALRLARERSDRLQRAIMEAYMWLSIGQHDRALQTLSQALTA